MIRRSLVRLSTAAALAAAAVLLGTGTAGASALDLDLGVAGAHIEWHVELGMVGQLLGG